MTMPQQLSPSSSIARRTVLKGAAVTAGAALAGPLSIQRGPSALAAEGPIVKPLPPRWYVDFGINAEMRWDSVHSDQFVTRNRRLFVRDHTVTPLLDRSTYELRLFGDALAGAPTAASPVSFSYDDLAAMPSKSITSFIECTGNGRSFFGSQQGQTVSGTAWGLGAIGVTRWRGVPLSEVLDRAGLLDTAVDVMAAGLDNTYVSGGVDYGHVRRPIPIEKALDDTLIALEMNGRDLLPDHGFPARLVVPGWVGIANIKWLGELEVSTTPLTSAWNTIYYRMTGGDYPADSPPLTVMPVKSALELEWNARVPARRRTVLRGRSWSGTSAIQSVDVSTDGGASYRPARLIGENKAHSWVRWALPWTPPEPGQYEVLARATDTSGRTQPDTVPFNSSGYLFWAVVRHPVLAVG